MTIWQVPLGKFTRATIKRVLDCMQLTDWAITVHLVDDEEMARMNDEHRGKNAATDVLSFPVRSRMRLLLV